MLWQVCVSFLFDPVLAFLDDKILQTCSENLVRTRLLRFLSEQLLFFFPFLCSKAATNSSCRGGIISIAVYLRMAPRNSEMK